MLPVTGFVGTYGPPVVFLCVFAEVLGVPIIPGELALAVAAVLAHRHQLGLGSALGSATVGAIAGQATAYALGRWRGRQILGWKPIRRVTEGPLQSTEAFFLRHGGKAVFIGRFLPILRSTIGWIAGVSRMPVRRFIPWCVAGGIVWAFSLGLAAFFLGNVVITELQSYGAIAVAGVVGTAVISVMILKLRKRRTAPAALELEQPPVSAP